MTIAIYGKHIGDEYVGCLKGLIAGLQERRCAVLCEEGFARLLEEKFAYVPGFVRTFGKEGLKAGEATMLLSIGGDGTFLDSIEYVKDGDVPVLGVNSGRLGFLANVRMDEIADAVNCITTGRYTTELREMLTLQVDGDYVSGFEYALNEIGLLKAETSSLLNIHAYIGNVYLTTYWADGLVVATPTGSTAYSLSGGGPIVSPDCRNLILTPICPHNLSIRPLVVPDDAEITLQVESRSGDFVLSMDSRIRRMKDNHRLRIRTGGHRVAVVMLEGHHYYETLRNKLMWGEDRRNVVLPKNGGVGA
ncbi:MAG: NAD kinase [Odoribacter sp.]|nr:NAD kinase [Odoribacter sp.]